MAHIIQATHISPTHVPVVPDVPLVPKDVPEVPGVPIVSKNDRPVLHVNGVVLQKPYFIYQDEFFFDSRKKNLV